MQHFFSLSVFYFSLVCKYICPQEEAFIALFFILTSVLLNIFCIMLLCCILIKFHLGKKHVKSLLADTFVFWKEVKTVKSKMSSVCI